MYAKKSLGQNFLKSERALHKIVEVGELTPQDKVLEIGPGRGALTEKLLASKLELIAVEKDDALYEELRKKFEKEISSGQLTLVHGDILDFDPTEYKLETGGYKLIANIPYNLTGAILKKFLSSEVQPHLMVLLVQKEVGERMVAKDRKESLLSISSKAYGTPLYIERVLAGSFVPAPQVDSAIVKVDRISKAFFTRFGEEAFFKMVKAGFQSKRKKLISNLSQAFAKDKVREVFKELNLDENVRAEEISIETWHKLGENLL